MNSIHYSVKCNAYKSNIFTGFSQLQKLEEFVDLTLAADGCIVKVHRNLIALASPYLRDILRSMSNHSPILFLNNVSYKVLSYLLEYIYQGEVNIPVDTVDEFIEVSKSLHIAGIEDLEPPKKKMPPSLTAKRKKPSERSIAGHVTINNRSVEAQQNPSANLQNNENYYESEHNMQDQEQKNIMNNAELVIQQNEELCNKETLVSLINIDNERHMLYNDSNQTAISTSQECPLPTHTDITQAFPDIPIDTDIRNQRNESGLETSTPVINVLEQIIIKPGVALTEFNSSEAPVARMEPTGTLPLDLTLKIEENMPQYSVTERGALQMILNRYLYCCHHSTRTKRRWRCIDYRQRKCPAIVDTADGAIVYRKGLHSHTFHDSKIYKKHKKGLIYQTFPLALAYRDSAEMKGLKTIPLKDEADI